MWNGNIVSILTYKVLNRSDLGILLLTQMYVSLSYKLQDHTTCICLESKLVKLNKAHLSTSKTQNKVIY